MKKICMIIMSLILTISMTFSSHAFIFDFIKSFFGTEQINIEETINNEEASLENYNSEEKKVVDKINEIYKAVKNIDIDKVVSLSDFAGSYDKTEIENIFNKYKGSREIVEALASRLTIDIKDLEKDGDDYKANINIDMVNIESVIAKLVPRVATDILGEKFSKGEVSEDDIANMVIKRIDEILEKGDLRNTNFDYNFVFKKVNGEYKLSTKDIIEEIYNKLKPFLDAVGVG